LPLSHVAIEGIIIARSFIFYVIGLEPGREDLLNGVDCENALSVHVLATEPFILGSVVLQPGVGREKDQEASGENKSTDILEELLGVWETTKKVRCNSAVIHTKVRGQIASISLDKLYVLLIFLDLLDRLMTL
jgi:hypothetical protein